QSMEDATGVKVIIAHVPLSEMFGYVGDLRSKTQGRAVYSMQFDSYSEAPRNVADEIIKKTRGGGVPQVEPVAPSHQPTRRTARPAGAIRPLQSFGNLYQSPE